MIKFELNHNVMNMQDRNAPPREWWTARIRGIGYAHVYEDATAECWRVRIDTAQDHSLPSPYGNREAAQERASNYVQNVLRLALADLEGTDAD